MSICSPLISNLENPIFRNCRTFWPFSVSINIWRDIEPFLNVTIAVIVVHVSCEENNQVVTLVVAVPGNVHHLNISSL